MDKEHTLERMLPLQIFRLLKVSGLEMEKLQEIRMNVGQPLVMKYDGDEVILNQEGMRIKEIEKAYKITETHIKETFEFICGHSAYAYQEEIKQGFLTVEGGHRIGIAGQSVWEQGKMRQLKYISALNIRLASQVVGSAGKLLPCLHEGKQFCNTLMIGPPCCGKTTLLRDCIRLLSDGDEKRSGVRVGVVDERGEIAACYRGVPQNNVGIRTDVLDRIPKPEGISMLVRAMSPRVIAVDEIGTEKDMKAIIEAKMSGCKILATIHGTDIEEVLQRPMLRDFPLQKFFERFVVLKQSHQGSIQGVFNKERERIW